MPKGERFLQLNYLNNMNADLVKQALAVVVNPNVLVNLVSRRVRQLNSGAGGACRPLLSGVANLSAADIALTEIAEEKMGWEMPEILKLIRPTGKNRKRPQHWAKSSAGGDLAGRVSK
jgi:DNA-directed RNA polymerase subunit omega